MKRLLGAFCIFVFAASIALAQGDNMLHVKSYPGTTVGYKVAAAMRSCTTETRIPCFLVLDPSLAVYPVGTMPTLCSHCYLLDYRTSAAGLSLEQLLQLFSGSGSGDCFLKSDGTCAIPTGTCGTNNIPCTNTSNLFNGGTQTIQSGDYTQPAAIDKGTVSGLVTPVYVRSVNGNNGLAMPVTAGDAIIFFTQGTMTVSDSVGDTFTHLFTNDGIGVYYTNHSVGGASVSFSGDGGSYHIEEYTNVTAGNVIDTYVLGGHGDNQHSFTATLTSTTYANELLIGGWSTGNSGFGFDSVTPASFTNCLSNMNIYVYACQSPALTIGGYSITLTNSAQAVSGSAFIIALKPGNGLAQTGDLHQFRDQDNNVKSAVNNIGQFVNQVGAGVPSNLPSAGAQMWDSTAKCLRIYDGVNWTCQTASASTCNTNGCYSTDGNGNITQSGKSAAVASSTSATTLAVTFPVAFTDASTVILNATAVSDAAGDGNPHPAACHVTRSSITTSGATVVIDIPTQVGGSGYDHLVAGDYCAFEAKGK